MDRRTFLRGAASSAAIILTPGLLMPVTKIVAPLEFNIIPIPFGGWPIGMVAMMQAHQRELNRVFGITAEMMGGTQWDVAALRKFHGWR